MNDKELERLSKNPKYAPFKHRTKKSNRSVNELFKNVDPDQTFKDKRGRPWVKNPKAYVKGLIVNPNEVDKETSFINSSNSDSDRLSIDESGGSESGSEYDINEKIADLQGADWNELVKDSKTTTNSSRRLALLHFDWDNANAETIYMILESFVPPKGHIEKVTIYPSEFGIKRLAEENVHGPLELRQISDNVDCTNDNEVVDIDDRNSFKKTSKAFKSRIREYQLARLKYFYAIIEFDSVETSDAVYEQCDGMEYENSGSRLDLRFVDDDEKFEVPHEYAHLVTECHEINKSKFEPVKFETDALHSTHVGITWDKTPSRRTKWFQNQFDPDADPEKTLTENYDELGHYLALSSSGASTAASSDVDAPGPAPTVPRIPKHRPKKLPPAEVRLALLGLVNSTGTIDNGINESEDEEEVFDLKDGNGNSDLEDYDLGPVEKKASKQTILSRKSKKVKRKMLPEAQDSDYDDNSSDEADFENSEDDMTNADDSKTNKLKNKREKKLKQRAKMLSKKQKVQDKLQREAKLWDDSIADDDRFDDFYKNPSFGISQTHPDYKKAADFLRFMHIRKSNS